MALITGTESDDNIAPTFVSSGVTGGAPSDADDQISGLDGNDFILGAGGNDTLYGGADYDEIGGNGGDDLIYGGDESDVLNGGEGADTLYGEHGDDALDGGEDQGLGADLIYGGSGNDRLTPGRGTDLLYGDAGDDTFFINVGFDYVGVVLDGGDGNDGILNSGDITALTMVSIEGLVLGSPVEGGGLVTLTAAQFASLLTVGGRGVLFGATAGTYDLGKIESVAVPTISFQGSVGADLIIGNPEGTGYAYGGATIADIEAGGGDDTFLGGAGLDQVHGGEGDDSIEGGDANDTLRGGGGEDLVFGGEGNDEISGQVWAGTRGTFQAAENDTLHGEGGDDVVLGYGGDDLLFGGSGADSLFGVLGNDLLDGGAGADSMEGDAGDDIYIVDDVGDIVVEFATVVHFSEGYNGGARDVVRSSVDYVLPDHVEVLELTGSADLDGSGNGLANEIFGNAGDNMLQGLGGNDTAAGGLGDDTYVLDSALDVVLEGIGEGIDTVVAPFTYTLADGLEHLVLAGTGRAKGTGNTLDNAITGNSARNTLNGRNGDDSLDGGGGSDVIIGGRGADLLAGGAKNDAFRYAARSEGGDVITDFGLGDDVFEISAAGFGGGLTKGMDIGATGRFIANTNGKADVALGQFVLNTATAELWFDANGTAAGGRTLIATLNTTAVTAADIVII